MSPVEPMAEPWSVLSIIRLESESFGMWGRKGALALVTQSCEPQPGYYTYAVMVIGDRTGYHAWVHGTEATFVDSVPNMLNRSQK